MNISVFGTYINLSRWFRAQTLYKNPLGVVYKAGTTKLQPSRTNSGESGSSDSPWVSVSPFERNRSNWWVPWTCCGTISDPLKGLLFDFEPRGSSKLRLVWSFNLKPKQQFYQKYWRWRTCLPPVWLFICDWWCNNHISFFCSLQ